MPLAAAVVLDLSGDRAGELPDLLAGEMEVEALGCNKFWWWIMPPLILLPYISWSTTHSRLWLELIM
jgi:hypothetical protein